MCNIENVAAKLFVTLRVDLGFFQKGVELDVDMGDKKHLVSTVKSWYTLVFEAH